MVKEGKSLDQIVCFVLYFTPLSQRSNVRVVLAQELKKEFVDPQRYSGIPCR
jgi:hypothetical protein